MYLLRIRRLKRVKYVYVCVYVIKITWKIWIFNSYYSYNKYNFNWFRIWGYIECKLLSQIPRQTSEMSDGCQILHPFYFLSCPYNLIHTTRSFILPRLPLHFHPNAYTVLNLLFFFFFYDYEILNFRTREYSRYTCGVPCCGIHVHG